MPRLFATSLPDATPTSVPKARLRHFPLAVPRQAQLAVLKLPVVQRQLVAERRAMLCEVVLNLRGGSMSQRHIARIFGACPSALSVWVRLYQDGGIKALLPKAMGRQPARGRATPCSLTLGLF